MALEPKTLKNNGWLKIGSVGPAHGIKGAFFCYTDDRRTEALQYKEILIVPHLDSGHETRTVESKVYEVRQSFLSAGKPVIALDDVFSRDKAEELLGSAVYVRRMSSELESDEFFVGDLVGLEVFCESELSETQKRGKVVAVHNFGAQFNLEVELMRSNENHASSDGTVLFPFMEAFIVTLDLDRKILVVKGLDQFV